MTAKKEAYSGPLLVSDMSAVGRERAQRAKAGATTGRTRQADCGLAGGGRRARGELSDGCEGDPPVSRCALNTRTAEQNGGRGRVT